VSNVCNGIVRRLVGVLFDEEMFVCCRSPSVKGLAAYTDGHCISTRGRSGVAVLALMDELELDKESLFVRRNEGQE
jgi:hypothetical protein